MADAGDGTEAEYGGGSADESEFLNGRVLIHGGAPERDESQTVEWGAS
jgi:hypothetical protein